MLVVTRRLPAAILVAVVSLLLVATVAFAQTSGGTSGAETGTGTTPAPTAVEPQAGEAAPPEPGQTTTAETPAQTTTSTTTTTPGTGGGIAVEGSTVTAGGAPGGARGGDGSVSWLTIAAIALAGLILFVIAVLILWRWSGWDPRWLRRWRHASAEAGWRLSLGWAEFRDFVRMGR